LSKIVVKLGGAVAADATGLVARMAREHEVWSGSVSMSPSSADGA